MKTEQIGNITLHNCDNIEFMRTVPDKHFDLAIVDPPYGLPKRSTTGQGKLQSRILNNDKMQWDTVPTEEYFIELFRVSRNQLIWGANNFTLPPTRGFICWDKVQPWPNFSACEYCWTSFDQPAKMFKFDNRTGDKIHPTQKPVELYKWLLKNYATCDQCGNEGRVIDNDFTKETIPCETCSGSFKIIDTHLGSGSIAIACHDYKFELTGCEIDSDYFEASVKRLKNHVAQTVLF